MRRRLEHLTLRCGLPEDALTGGARVTVFGRGSVLVEGQRGVVELSPERIRLRTGRGVLSVLGRGLSIRELSVDAAMIVGESVDSAAYDGVENGRR